MKGCLKLMTLIVYVWGHYGYGPDVLTSEVRLSYFNWSLNDDIADLKPLSGTRVFGFARWSKNLEKVSSELARNHQA